MEQSNIRLSPRSSNDPRPEKDESDWDCVAEASWQSFPASDPPSWPDRHLERLAGNARPDNDEREAVEIQGDSFVVDSTILARLLDIPPADVQPLMREGRITSLCEEGIDEDRDQFRLTFFYGHRHARLSLDRSGRILDQAVSDEQIPAAATPFPGV